MKDAKVTQIDAKDQDGPLASSHSLISYVKSKKSKTTRKNKGSTFVTVLFSTGYGGFHIVDVFRKPYTKYLIVKVARCDPKIL